MDQEQPPGPETDGVERKIAVTADVHLVSGDDGHPERLSALREILERLPDLVANNVTVHTQPQLVQQAVGLVEAGWQVLYFTMDDHIRDLFNTVGDRLGKRYVSHSLFEPSPSEDR